MKELHLVTRASNECADGDGGGAGVHQVRVHAICSTNVDKQ